MADLSNLPSLSWFIQEKNGNLQKQILCFPTERPVSILWANKTRTKQYVQQKQM